MPDDTADSLMRRAGELQQLAKTLADKPAVKVLEEIAAELIAQAQMLLGQPPPTGEA